jgi:hypothetical protein
MIISDLGYLEEVSQSISLTGGLGFYDSITQYNIADVRQYATAYSLASAYKGNAVAISNSTNNSLIGQSDIIS